MLLAFAIMASYLVTVVGTAAWLKIRPVTPDPMPESPVVARVLDYLRKGRR